MRIGIDARIFKYKEYRGIATATYNIIKELSVRDEENDYFLISNCKINIPIKLSKKWHFHVEGLCRNGVIWTLFELPRIIKKLKIDVFWGPNFLLPPRIEKCKYIVTVHDLALFKFKKTASRSTYLILKLLGKRSCERADMVLAVSDATKKDIIDVYGIRSEKIVVMHNGIDDTYLKNVISSRPSTTPIDEHDYFIFLGTIEPRKNPVTVLKAYVIYRDKGFGAEKLVFVGADGWNLKDFKESLNVHRYREDIYFTGYVSESEKKWLIENSVSLLFPTLYEGFGIPILEAFALGTPVIATNTSSIPEVGGDACIYIENPMDASEIAGCMEELKHMSDEDLSDLRQKMNEQVLKLSWKKSVDVLTRVIKII